MLVKEQLSPALVLSLVLHVLVAGIVLGVGARRGPLVDPTRGAAWQGETFDVEELTKEPAKTAPARVPTPETPAEPETKSKEPAPPKEPDTEARAPKPRSEKPAKPAKPATTESQPASSAAPGSSSTETRREALALAAQAKLLASRISRRRSRVHSPLPPIAIGSGTSYRSARWEASRS
jgi:outer membrane biosynthesis protein TonB